MMPPCPVCASQATQEYLYKNGCTIYVCTRCQFRFVYPLPDVREVYGKSYFSGAEQGFGYAAYDRDKEPMVPTFKKYLAKIRSFAPSANRLLDVGAATGFFVSLAQADGFDAEGIEISTYAVEQGTALGRNVRVGKIQDVPIVESSVFDVITMIDVIEHVPNPEADLQAARALLDTGGILLINTPDTGSWYARFMGRAWHLHTPPEHIAYFNRKNMRIVLERNGFSVIEEGTLGKQFTLPYIFMTLYAWQGLGIWRILANISTHGVLARIKVPINLGDNMLVFARAV